MKTRAATATAAAMAAAAEANKKTASSSDVTSPADGTFPAVGTSFIPMTTLSSNDKEEPVKRRTRSAAKAEAEAKAKKRRSSVASTPANVPANDPSFIPMTTDSSGNTPSTNEEGFDLSIFANMEQESSYCPVEQPSLPKPVNPGMLTHSKYGLRELEKPRLHNERVNQELKKRNAKSIEEAEENHDAWNVDLSNPHIQPALEELDLGEQGRFASQVEMGYEEQMAAILSVDSENKLPQQHRNLTGKQVLKVNYKTARRGGPNAGKWVGYKFGDLGTTTNSKGKTTDKAIGDAMRAADNLGEHNAEKALNLSTKIPECVREQGNGRGKMPAGSIQLINENDDPIDHRNTTENEFGELVREEARGFELENTASYKAFLAQIYPNDAKKMEWSTLRKRFCAACQMPGVEMTFKMERFDDQGVLPGTEVLGPKATRRKLAKYRFRLTDEKQGFEY